MIKPTIKELVSNKILHCPICERPNMHPSDHHMIPRSRGGRTTETICADCHKAIHANSGDSYTLECPICWATEEVNIL